MYIWVMQKFSYIGEYLLPINRFSTHTFALHASKPSKAPQQYLQLTGVVKSNSFYRASNCHVGKVIGLCSDRDCKGNSITDAIKVRDALLDSSLDASDEKRPFNTINPIFNLILI